MSGRFEILGEEGAVCADGVCLPPASGEQRARAAAEAAGIAFEVTRHGPVGSLEEAARARGIAPSQIVKTLVVRRAADDYILVLVPGDRSLSWPKLRRVLGVNRLSLPDAATAREATGYERGTITPFGAHGDWPVLVDEAVEGTISVGGGAHGVALSLRAADLLRVFDALVADVSD